MSDRIYAWRWRLARRIAPVPIMHDLLDGEDGVFVVMRERGTSMRFRADRFRMRSRLHLPKSWDRDKVFGDLSRWSTTHFAGTVHR